MQSLQLVSEHDDYAFFQLFMLSSKHLTAPMEKKEADSDLLKAFTIVPNVKEYIYCLTGEHLLAVYTHDNRYVLHLGSPLVYCFPLIESYEVP